MSSHTSIVPFLPGHSSVSWAVRAWAAAKVMLSVNDTCSLYRWLIKTFLVWCPTLPLLHFPSGCRGTKGELWFPVWHGGKPSTNHEHTFELWVRNKLTLHLSIPYLRTCFLQQLVLPSLTYLFYGKHHLHPSSNRILRTTIFIQLKNNVL